MLISESGDVILDYCKLQSGIHTYNLLSVPNWLNDVGSAKQHDVVDLNGLVYKKAR